MMHAVECLSDLITKYHTTIDAYHCRGWAHMEIRLENLCFDVRFQPVLIDLDRSIPNVQHCTFSSDSCIYGNLTGGKTDYVQLGWLAAWVAAPRASTDYHRRQLSVLPTGYQADPILRKLINDGRW